MLEIIITTLMFTVILACVYSVAVVGLNLIFGVMGIINFAHGDLITLGGYAAYWMWVLFSLDPITSIPISAMFGFVLGFFLFRSLMGKSVNISPEYMVIVTFSLGLVFQEAMKILWTADYRGIPWTLGDINVLPHVSIPMTYIMVCLASVSILLIMYFLLYRTYFGKSIRALVCNPEAAAICGVNIRKTMALGFALGISLTLIGGNLLIIYAPISLHPYMGREYILKCLIVAILGGLGNPWGSLIGSLIFAFLEQFLPQVLNILPGIEPLSFTPFICFLIFIIMLTLRPRGILGAH